MKSEYEELQSKVKRRFSFRYNPEYTEMFETTIERDEIIPLAIEVCEKLEWSIVYADENSVEAKRKGSWNKLTEKNNSYKECIW